jgi:hypothetical protein
MGAWKFYGTDGGLKNLGIAPAGQVFLSGAGMWPSATSGCALNQKIEAAANKQNVYVLDFPDAATSYAEGNLAMPSDWDGGVVTARFYWMANDASGNAALWGCQGRAYGDGDLLDQAWGTPQTILDSDGGVANQVRISDPTPAITLAGSPQPSELVLFRVERLGGDASDTLAATARLLGVMIGYSRS